jgi:hypothetical protein
VAASINALPLGEPVEWPPVSRSGKSERSALGAPVQRQAGVGHQLVGSKIGGLFAIEDRCDDIRRQMVQSTQAGGIRPAHVFADAMSSSVEPGFSARRLISLRARTISRVRLGSAFELGWRGEPNDGLSRIVLISGPGWRSAALPQTGFMAARLEKLFDESLRAEVDIDAIDAHLDPHDYRTEDHVPRVLAPIVKSSDDFCGGSVSPPLRRRVTAMLRQRFEKGDRIGEE